MFIPWVARGQDNVVVSGSWQVEVQSGNVIKGRRINQKQLINRKIKLNIHVTNALLLFNRFMAEDARTDPSSLYGGEDGPETGRVACI